MKRKREFLTAVNLFFFCSSSLMLIIVLIVFIKENIIQLNKEMPCIFFHQSLQALIDVDEIYRRPIALGKVKAVSIFFILLYMAVTVYEVYLIQSKYFLADVNWKLSH